MLIRNISYCLNPYKFTMKTGQYFLKPLLCDIIQTHLFCKVAMCQNRVLRYIYNVFGLFMLYPNKQNTHLSPIFLLLNYTVKLAHSPRFKYFIQILCTLTLQLYKMFAIKTGFWVEIVFFYIIWVGDKSKFVLFEFLELQLTYTFEKCNS